MAEITSTEKLIDLPLLTQFATYGVRPLKLNLDAVDNRVTDLEALVPEEVSYTLLAADWNAETFTYSLEEDYPTNQYDVDMYLDDDNANELARTAFVDHILYGGSTNVIHAGIGSVPTVDIPVILKVIEKPIVSPSVDDNDNVEEEVEDAENT